MDATETAAAIDRALAGQPPASAAPLERELADLTRTLAAEAATPDPDFAAQLDERVAIGFPRDGWRASLTHRRARAAAALRRTATRPPLALAGGLACAVIGLAAVVGLAGENLLDGGRETGEMPAVLDSPPPDRQPPSRQSEGGVVELARPGLETTSRGDRPRSTIVPAPPESPSPPGDRDFAPGAGERRIERSATLALAAPDDRLDRVAAGIARVTDRHGGFVLSSDLTVGDDGAAAGGEFELRIPTGRLDAALADLARLGQVRSRTTSGRDITAATVTAGDRLQAARAERRGLLDRLERADTDNEADALRIRLDSNAREIDRLQARVRALRLRGDYATVAVALQSADADADGSQDRDGDGLGAALDDAADSLSAALELLIRALGIALPIALLAGGAWLATRTLRRRRREAALRDSG